MSFYGVTDVWTYVIGVIGIILLPGPNSLFVLSVATLERRKNLPRLVRASMIDKGAIS